MLCCASCNITGHLDLASNSLSGTLPSEVGFLTQLSESPFAWLHSVTSCCVFSCIPMVFIFHSTAYLGLFNNSLPRLTGVIPSEIGSLSNLSESSNVLFLLLVMQIVAMCTIMLAIIFIL
jgi:hypothetical protein